MRTFEDAFRFLIEHRTSVLVMHGLLLATALVGAANLQVDYSAEQFFLFGGPEREVFDQFKRHFPREDLQVSALLEVAGPLRLEDYRRLDRLAEAFRSSGLHSVRWLGEADLVEETLEDGLPAVRLFQISEDADLSESRINALLEARRDHPLFSGALWNSELTVFAVHGYLAADENNDARRRQLTREIQDQIRSLAPRSGRIALTGLPVLRATIPLALEADLVRLVGIGLLISFVVLYGYFRRLGLVVLCLGAVVPAILFTLGMMGLVGQPISVLSGFMPIVVLVVAVSDATHLVVGTRSRWQEGLPISDAVVDAFSSVARTCFFTSLTTALGFLGLVATRIPIIVEFGVITAVAVLVAYLVTLTLLPALLTLAGDLGTPGNGPNRWSAWIIRQIERTLHASPRWPTAVLLVCLVTGLVLGVGLRVEALLIDDLKPDDPILRELRWIEDAGFGLFQINVYLTDGDQPGHSQEMLRWIEDLQAFARADPIVIGSMALPDFVRELGAVFGSDGQARASGNAGTRATPLAWTTEEVRELLFLAELESADALEEVYVREEGVGQVVFYVRDGGSTHLSPFLTKLEDRLDAVPPPSGSAHVTGTVKLSQILWDQLLARFLPGVLLSVVLVWMAMAWMFRSVRLGLLALVPNLVPMVMLLGLMRVGGFDLKPSTVIVFAIAFGIVADDTIHFLGAVARRLRATSDIDTVLLGAVREVGPALIITTAVVCGGFIVLTASRFQALFLIGFLTAASSLFAVGADLVGFPALLRLVARRPWVQSLLQRRSP